MRAILFIAFIILVIAILMSMSCSTPSIPPTQGSVAVGDGNLAPITTTSTASTTTVNNSIDKRLIAAFLGLFLIGLALPSFPKLWVNFTLGGVGVALIAFAAFL